MLGKLIRLKPKVEVAEDDSVRERAGKLFASGLNCTQAVLQAAGSIDDPKMMEMAKAFGGGIGGCKCLCGAVSGGVMVLGLKGKSAQADRLIKAFKAKYKVTCCSALTRSYQWKSREHLANCRSITEETAAMVEKILKG